MIVLDLDESEIEVVGDGTSFDGLMSQLRNSDNEAAAIVFDRYANRLLELARHRLGNQLLQKVDVEEVVQSAFKSFFRRNPNQKDQFEAWENLWGMLVVITLRKCGKWADFFYAEKRDVRREVNRGLASSDSGEAWQPPGNEPAPSDVAIFAETVEQLMSDLKTHEREILSMRLQSYTVREIAESVDLTERSVHRVLKRVRLRLDGQCGSD